MDINQAVQDLHKCVNELKIQNRLKRLRRVLRFFLIGFLIGRGADKRISELTEKKKSIIRQIEERLEEIEVAYRQIEEISKNDILLNAVEQKQWMLILRSFLQDFTILKESGALQDILEKYRQILMVCSRNLLTQRKDAISKEFLRVNSSGTYLVYGERERLLSSLKSFEEDLVYYGSQGFLGEEFMTSRKQELEKHRQFISDYNADFVDQRKREYSYLFNKSKLSLDDEQRNAIVTDDKHNLVVAAAGSGKTEVLITRIAYLIERKPDGIKPNRILAIAFQDKAKGEIEQRLRDRHNIMDVNVRTFHKLGKDLLEASMGQRFGHTSIIDENKKTEMICKIYESKLKTEKDYYETFIEYVRTFYDRQKNSQDKENVLVQKEILSNVSINNTSVKSKAEKEIMDFFLMHELNDERIKIEYEPDLAEFRPDFRLTNYDLYIEHWGINEKGEVADWFDQSAEEYRENMERKRLWFHQNNKLLVETFAYEYVEKERETFLGLLRERVLQKLQSRFDIKFEFALMTYEEIVEVAWATYKDPTPNDIANFIKNAKTYGLTPERIEEKLKNGKWSSKQHAFGRLALGVYRNYEQELQKHNKIDFEDMINKAIDALLKDTGLCADTYDHILIDEYQDISAQRNRLIGMLLERNPTCKLFCVGDDWQSIMGFAGSNLNFIVNFKEYFPSPAITKISTNYRSMKTIVEAGAELMKNNGRNQIQKITLSCRNDTKPIKVLRSTHKRSFETEYYKQTVEDCLNRITEYVNKGLAPKDILVLSRYRFPWIVRLFVEKAQERGILISYDKEFSRKNQIRLMTAHKSKGLQAKVVFILNVVKDLYGFPCEIEDSSIYEPARENYPRQDQKQEERRLFYVAMTRAMEDLIIYTWEPAESEFLEEIKEHIDEEALYY
jgi:DNA helicase-4